MKREREVDSVDAADLLYEWTVRTRDVLMAHLASIPQATYDQPLPVLAGESVRERQRHIAVCYGVWLGRGLGGMAMTDAIPALDGWRTAADAPVAFAQVDALVARFLARHAGALDRSMTVEAGDERLAVTPRWLLTHPVTHEFHHKGQIVVAVRLLGHPAPDTDLVLP